MSPQAVLYLVESPESCQKSKNESVFNRLIDDVNRRFVARKNLDELSKIMKIEEDERQLGPKKKIDRDHAEIVFRRLIQDATDRKQARELRNAIKKLHEDSSPKVTIDSRVKDERILSLLGKRYVEYGRQSRIKIEAARRAKELRLIKEAQDNVQKLHPKRKQDPETWKRLLKTGNEQSKNLSNSQIDTPRLRSSHTLKQSVIKGGAARQKLKKNTEEKVKHEVAEEFMPGVETMKKKLMDYKSTRVSTRPSLDLELYDFEAKSTIKTVDTVNLMIPRNFQTLVNLQLESSDVKSPSSKSATAPFHPSNSLRHRETISTLEDLEVPSKKVHIPTLNFSKLQAELESRTLSPNSLSYPSRLSHNPQSQSLSFLKKPSKNPRQSRQTKPSSLIQSASIPLFRIERLVPESFPPEPEPGASIPTPEMHPDLSCMLSSEIYNEEESCPSVENEMPDSELSFYPSKKLPVSKLSKSIPSIWETFSSLVNIKEEETGNIISPTKQ